MEDVPGATKRVRVARVAEFGWDQKITFSGLTLLMLFFREKLCGEEENGIVKW